MLLVKLGAALYSTTPLISFALFPVDARFIIRLPRCGSPSTPHKVENDIASAWNGQPDTSIVGNYSSTHFIP